MTQVQQYLDKLCTKINRRHSNVIYVFSNDGYFSSFLDSESATWVQKTKINGEVYLPRYNQNFKIVRASDNARGYKPREALIDSRISLEILQTVIEPSLIVCTKCGWF